MIKSQVQKNKNILDGIIFDKNNEKFSFNDDILFPTEHLEILLENAKKNIKTSRKFESTLIY